MPPSFGNLLLKRVRVESVAYGGASLVCNALKARDHNHYEELGGGTPETQLQETCILARRSREV